jgi:hypothetical protein
MTKTKQNDQREVVEKIRESKKNEVLQQLGLYNVKGHLKGSWENNDFHLDLNGKTTYSDVDLFIPDINSSEKKILITLLEKKISSLFSNYIKVSIHNRNSLSIMNIQDAKILALGEYVSTYKKYVKKGLVPRDYFIAKTLLNLHRKSLDEKYVEIKNNRNFKILNSCFDVKLGILTKLEKAQMDDYFSKTCNDNLLNFFLENCYYMNPDKHFENKIFNWLYEANSIEDWLRDYLIKKMK